MDRIHPIDGPTVQRYVGQTVCAVTHDGTHYYGTIEGIDGDSLIIHGYTRGPGEVATYGWKKRRGRNKIGKAKTSAFFPGFGFRRFFLPFAALSLLFLLPFLAFPFIF